MCLQCIVKAVYVKPEDPYVLPGFTLMRSTLDNKDWPLGTLGLVQHDDPTYILRAIPMLYSTLSEEEKEYNRIASSRTVCFVEEEDSSQQFYIQLNILEKDLLSNPMCGYELISAAKKTGYNLEVDGNFTWWFLEHLYKYISGSAHQFSASAPTEQMVTFLRNSGVDPSEYSSILESAEKSKAIVDERIAAYQHEKATNK